MDTWKRRHIRKDTERSEAYRAGLADHLESDSVTIYGRWNTTPSAATREEWGAAYPLYLAGWLAAEKLA